MDIAPIQFNCPIDPTTIKEIMNILPEWKTLIRAAEVVDDKLIRLLQLKLSIAVDTVEEIVEWVKLYEEKNKTTFPVRCTNKCSGRYVTFKQRRYCHRNTACKRVYDPLLKTNTRNTNCPARITITLRSRKSRHRYKNSNNAPNPEYPCEIEMVVTHNHDIDTADALQFRPVSNDVKETLLGLFENGHSPATALQILKMEIQLKHDDYEKILADRKYCPDYSSCYYIYRQVFKKLRGQPNFDDEGKDFVAKMLRNFNTMSGDNSAEFIFEENNYVICVCPLFMKRVHANIELSSDVVFIASFKGRDGCRIFVLLTHSASGELPLGIIITSSESTDLITKGLQLLQTMVGDEIFYRSIEGPRVVFTNDCEKERVAFKSVWPKSVTFLGILNVLKAVWCWLTDEKNGIPEENQYPFFLEFKAILKATTEIECSEKYAIACGSARPYGNYCNYLADYWERKELWALCYRQNMPVIVLNSVRLLKEKIFQRVEAFNVIQMVHFIITKYINYYEVTLLDVALKRPNKNMLNKPNVLARMDFIENMQCLTDSLILVPSENKERFFYVVSTDEFTCTCVYGNSHRICKHMDWACCLIYSDKYIAVTENNIIRSLFYEIATGKELPSDLEVKKEDTFVTTLLSLSDSDISSTKLLNRNIESVYQEDNLVKGKKIIEEIGSSFTSFLEKSPQQVFSALEAMKKRVNSFKTISEMVSACCSFGIDSQRKCRVGKIPVQRHTISRRKRLLSDKYSVRRKISTKSLES